MPLLHLFKVSKKYSYKLEQTTFLIVIEHIENVLTQCQSELEDCRSVEGLQ